MFYKKQNKYKVLDSNGIQNTIRLRMINKLNS